jgi:NAD(P)-dependent dehydrogenase (short-subunit alcohol dehydrogenase family)
MDRVKGKVAVVTGGALGIGRATCLLLAREGAAVVVADVLKPEGDQTTEDIRRRGGTADFHHIDVTDEGEVERLFADTRQRRGRIDILVNNAGISGADKPTDQLTADEWIASWTSTLRAFSSAPSTPYRICARPAAVVLSISLRSTGLSPRRISRPTTPRRARCA